MEHQEDMDADGAQDLSIPADIAHFYRLGVLGILLADRTTGSNIIWATSAYEGLGGEFAASSTIGTACIIGGDYSTQLRRRAQKEHDEQAALTRNHAEVFTPMWVCKLMIDHADTAWMESRGIDSLDDAWREYVKSNRLEITCGEAPYLVSRYDAESGQVVPLAERTGILDRKLRLVTSHVQRRQDWILWATKAVQSTYGYDFQGDNLLIARINILRSVEDHLAAAGYSPLQDKEYKRFADIISWNLWQMDGLTYTIPFGHLSTDYIQDDLFGDMFDDSVKQEGSSAASTIWDWKTKETVEYRKIRREGKTMKFDFVIGNPPYQEEQEGDNATFAPPIYNRFMDGAFEISDSVELITPARFLFNAGSTPKAWNRKMLSDPHLKVMEYWEKSSDVFPDADIRGGVAITYRDSEKEFGSIGIFTPYSELNSILKKLHSYEVGKSIIDIIHTQVRFDLNALYKDYPQLKSVIGSNGRDKRFRNNIFDKINLFSINASENDIHVIGIQKNKRTWRYINKKYVDLNHETLNAWKVLITRANGSGIFGETLSTPIIAEPMVGFTQSFISFGPFNKEIEAENCLKYIKGKFARTLLSVLKITQDNDRGAWQYVPLQDFSSESDIDWSQKIPDIDAQLYRKYGLSQEEIDFIESHVKEMD